jgi:hypothetical protein
MVAGGLAGSLLAGTAIVSVYRGMADDVGPLPGPTGPGATTLASADSVASLTAPPLDGLTDSVVEPPGRATLRVFAPAGTRLSLNGAALPLRGASWSDTLQPGRYEVRAAVPPSGGCEAADTVLTVDLAANQQRAVRITPPVCGTLTLLVTPTPARFALVPIAGGVPREGTLPLSEPLVLAEGTYRLTVAAPRCATYTDEQLTISAARGARQERVTLLCD